MRTIELTYVGRRIRSGNEYQANHEVGVTSWQSR
jgi:hypothetical protein